VEYAKVLGPAFVSAVAVVISAISVCLSRQIAHWQASIAIETLRQNNYDRRAAIYDAFCEMLAAIVDKKDADAELRKANSARLSSPFLLNEKLAKLLEDLHNEAFRLDQKDKLLTHDQNYRASVAPQQLAEEGKQLGSDKLKLSNRVQELTKEFGPFLKPRDLRYP
jgi:hypothetical protein